MLLRRHRTGADVEVKLPLLATYLGHGSALSTPLGGGRPGRTRRVRLRASALGSAQGFLQKIDHQLLATRFALQLRLLEVTGLIYPLF